MKISELVKALQDIQDTNGDLDCTISCKLDDAARKSNQGCLISTPMFVVVETVHDPIHCPDDPDEVMIRDWAY